MVYSICLKSVLCIIIFAIASSQTFFIQTKDITKMLRSFPKLFEAEVNRMTRPYEPYQRQTDYYNDRSSNSKSRNYGKTDRSNRPHYHHDGTYCDHPEHQHERFQKVKIFLPPKPEVPEPTEEKVYEEPKSEKVSNVNFKKDYITGVIVAIPKIKSNGANLDSYYKNSAQQNGFLAQLLKGQEYEQHHEDYAEESGRSYSVY